MFINFFQPRQLHRAPRGRVHRPPTCHAPRPSAVAALPRGEALGDHGVHHRGDPFLPEAGDVAGHPVDDLGLPVRVAAGVPAHLLLVLDGGGERHPAREQHGQLVVDGVDPPPQVRERVLPSHAIWRSGAPSW